MRLLRKQLRQCALLQCFWLWPINPPSGHPHTPQAVPLKHLVERTFTATAQEVERNHAKWLKANRHLRYMWLPYTDTVVVVQVRRPSRGQPVPPPPPPPAYCLQQVSPLRLGIVR